MLSTSLLFIGIPFALAYVDEHQALEIEREQKARETAGEVSCWIFFCGYQSRKCRLRFSFILEKADALRGWLLPRDWTYSIEDLGSIFKA